MERRDFLKLSAGAFMASQLPETRVFMPEGMFFGEKEKIFGRKCRNFAEKKYLCTQRIKLCRTFNKTKQ